MGPVGTAREAPGSCRGLQRLPGRSLAATADDAAAAPVQAEAVQGSIALLKAEKSRINERVAHQNALAQSNRNSRRHGAVQPW